MQVSHSLGWFFVKKDDVYVKVNGILSLNQTIYHFKYHDYLAVFYFSYAKFSLAVFSFAFLLICLRGISSRNV